VYACRDSRAHGANALALALTYMPADFKDAGLLVTDLATFDKQIQQHLYVFSYTR
jgi:hypothetical protein